MKTTKANTQNQMWVSVPAALMGTQIKKSKNQIKNQIKKIDTTPAPITGMKRLEFHGSNDCLVKYPITGFPASGRDASHDMELSDGNIDHAMLETACCVRTESFSEGNF